MTTSCLGTCLCLKNKGFFRINGVFILYLSFTLFSQLILAQTHVDGLVVDESNQPIPYASVYFKNSSIGTFTDFNGNFKIEANKIYKTLLISCMGFNSEEISINSHKITNLKILLKEGQQLKEVVIMAYPPKKRLKKKENPAYRILKKVWTHIGSNGLNKSKNYQYKKYTSRETGIVNIDTTFIKSILGSKSDLKRVLKLIKTNNNGSNSLYIPLRMEERVSSIYGDNVLGKKKEDILAERQNGIKVQGFLFSRIGFVFDNVDIYKNNFQLFNTSFVSPLSKGGFATYDYVLQDSTKIGKHKQYTISFFLRRDGDLGFEGHFKVDEPSYAVSSIDMRLSKNNNINLVKGIFVKKQYDIINDSIFVEKENNYEAEYTLLSNSDKEKGMYFKKIEIFDNYMFDLPKDKTFYDNISPKVSQSQFTKDSIFWKNTNMDDINVGRLNYLNQIKDNKRINRLNNIINVLSSGYVPLFKNIQWGRYWNTFTYNDIEGLRIRFGVRTFKTLDDRFSSTGYLSYGTLDSKLKYGVDSRYLVSKYPRIILNLVVSNDLQQTANVLLDRRQTIINVPFLKKFAFVRGNNYYLTEVFKKSIGADFEISKNFHLGSIVTHEAMKAASPESFNLSFSDNTTIKNTFDITKFSFYSMFTPGRKPFGLGAVQRFGRNLFPTLLFRYTKSSQEVFSDYNFDKVQILYNHPILLGGLGVFDPTIQFGKTFGTLPVNLLDAIPANQSYTTSNSSFSLLNYFDFVTDMYGTFFIEHRFNGFVMNRVPWVNKLKLRGLAFARGAYGSISKENIKANKGNIIYNSLSNHLYLEYGFGFYNIGFGNLRFFRVEFIWRNDIPKGFVRNERSSEIPSFGIRVGLVPKF